MWQALSTYCGMLSPHNVEGLLHIMWKVQYTKTFRLIDLRLSSNVSYILQIVAFSNKSARKNLQNGIF